MGKHKIHRSGGPSVSTGTPMIQMTAEQFSGVIADTVAKTMQAALAAQTAQAARAPQAPPAPPAAAATGANVGQTTQQAKVEEQPKTTAKQEFADSKLSDAERDQAVKFCETLATGKHQDGELKGQALGMAGLGKVATEFGSGALGRKILGDEELAGNLHNVLSNSQSTSFAYSCVMGLAKFIGGNILGSAEQMTQEYAAAKQELPDEVRAKTMIGNAFAMFAEHGVKGLGPALALFTQVPTEHRGIFGHIPTVLTWIDNLVDNKLSSNLAQAFGKGMSASLQKKDSVDIEFTSLGVGEKIKGLFSMVTGFFKGSGREDAFLAEPPGSKPKTKVASQPTANSPTEQVYDTASRA